MQSFDQSLLHFSATIPPQPPAMPRTRTKWKPPDARCFKINFDRAIFRQENKSEIGVVILTAPALQPIEIEAITAARALEFGQEIGITEAVLEGDSELII